MTRRELFSRITFGVLGGIASRLLPPPEQVRNISVPMTLHVSSLDPESAAALILANEGQIIGMVAKNINRGSTLAQAIGRRHL